MLASELEERYRLQGGINVSWSLKSWPWKNNLVNITTGHLHGRTDVDAINRLLGCQSGT